LQAALAHANNASNASVSAGAAGSATAPAEPGSNVNGNAARLRVHRFQARFMEEPVFGQILVLKNSFFVWIGNSAGRLDNLEVALPLQTAVGLQDGGKRGPAVSSSSNLLGFAIDGSGQSLAARLAKRTGSQWFVSYNLPAENQQLNAFVERKLLEELKTLRS